jgi:hypothetical protein
MIQAAYPGFFSDDDSDETWDSVMNFVGSLSGFEDIAVLLGRVIMLTVPLRSPLTGKLSRCLGKVEITEDNKINMDACVKRDFV